jgi:hypothetical protein
MKRLLTIGLLALATATNAQFNDEGKTIDALCGHKIFATVEGDLNKDGINDVFFAATSEADATVPSYYGFYFGNKNGGYTLIKHHYDMPLTKNAKFTINDKGVLRIQNDFGNGNSDIFLFRYQNGGFYLIGGKKDRHKFDHYDFSYNFSTKKMIKTTGEGKNATTETLEMKDLPVLKFGWFPLNWDQLEYFFDSNLDSEYKTVMGIFRLLQVKEAMHWAFCEYDNDYHNPHGSNGRYECTLDFTGGSYWVYETLKFIKKSDDVWDIEYFSEGGERTYEEYTEDNGETFSGPSNGEATNSSTEDFSFEDGIFVYG